MVPKQFQEIAFQLVSMVQSYFSPPMVGFSVENIAFPFGAVDFNPKHNAYLRDILLAQIFPNLKNSPLNLILGEPYYSMMEEDEVRHNGDPPLPKAVKTKVLKQIPVASMCSVIADNNKNFDLETMQKSMGFDFRKFWLVENIGISPHESMHSDLTALETKANEFHTETARYNPSTLNLTS